MTNWYKVWSEQTPYIILSLLIVSTMTLSMIQEAPTIFKNFKNFDFGIKMKATKIGKYKFAVIKMITLHFSKSIIYKSSKE
jgi:hypothetical protein